MSDIREEMTSAVVEAYLKAHNWDFSGEIPGLATIWSGPLSAGIQVAVPTDPSIGDYAARMADVARVVADYESRATSEVVEDMLGRFSGIVSVRVLGDDTSLGKIPIKDGLVAVAKLKSLFAAAAQSLGARRPVFGSKIPEVARSYLDSLLLGQTEVGSYVINAYAPADWPSKKAVSPTYGTSVISSMAVALRAIEDIVQQGVNPEDGFAALDQAVSFGVSANLCDALLGFAGTRGSRPFEIRVKIPSAGLMEADTRCFSFDSAASQKLKTASSYYKGDYIVPNVVLVGLVRELSRVNQYDPGQVIVQARVADSERSIAIQLNPDDYHVAIVAHDEGSFVTCSGNVRIKAGRATLLDPRDFAIVDVGPALL